MTRPPILRWQAALAVLLAVVGFLAVVQQRSRQPLRQATDLPTWRLQELAVLVRQQETVREALQREVETLQRQVREFEAALTEGRGLSEAMARELAQYRLVLGLVPVEGPGVRVTVAEDADAGGVLPSAVHAQDLSGLANELWSAGAEAMAINGVRVMATTGIRSADGRLEVGDLPVAPPYRLEAIGDPAAMQAALAIRGGFVDGLRAVGVRVEVRPEARIRLPARPGTVPFRHARRQSVE
ncbi:MAG: DUF881 domain-containing protein [Armatimonadota bacterium]|nr:DUF881 domain-containing protein [Armatimonadota bacterium]